MPVSLKVMTLLAKPWIPVTLAAEDPVPTAAGKVNVCPTSDTVILTITQACTPEAGKLLKDNITLPLVVSV